MGTFKYLKRKNLYLYLVVINYEPEVKCNSYFIDKNTNEKVPEMVDFKWIEFDDYKKYFSVAMNSTFDEMLPKVKHYLEK